MEMESKISNLIPWHIKKRIYNLINNTNKKRIYIKRIKHNTPRRELMKKYEELDITDPFIFAKVMSDKRLCKPLLESILNIKIRDIEYVDYE